jgi:PKHD-type hydroxylase
MQLILVCEMDLLCIADVFGPDEVAALRARIDLLPRIDGRRTAGWAAADAKHNLQLDGESEPVRALQAELRAGIESHPLLRLYARPHRITLPLLSEYTAGMRYDRHVDDALMGEPALRTDLAFTVFLASPGAYEGGELILDGTSGELPLKLDAGAMVIYPAGASHRVAAVAAGRRLAAVGWIQSRIRDPRQREVLFDLDRTRRELFEREGDSDAFAALSRCSGTLQRMWAEV